MTNEEMKKNFASNIEYFIARSGKTQREVAIDMGIEPTTFNTWCKGKILPRLQKLQKIAEYFNCRVEDLIEFVAPRSLNRMIEVSPEEEAVIKAFRDQPEDVKAAICRMLNVMR